MQDRQNSFGPFMLDPSAREVRRDGEPLPLGQRAFDLLAALVEANGAAVDKDALMSRAWPGLFVEEANLSVQIAALRKALGKAPDGQEWIATVPRVGYRLPRRGPEPAPGPATGRPLVAVLPFVTPPDDAEQAYFADGVVEDLITALSRFKAFAVVSRNAAFGYRERGLDAGAMGLLGIRYLVEGTVRRRGTQVRVNVRLVEAATATQLWGQQFDGDGAELFRFFDDVVIAVVGFVEPEVRRAEIERARRKHPGSLDAYDCYLRALPLFRGTSPEVRSEAIRLLEESVRLDPGFATGLAYAAWAYERQDTFGSGGMSDSERKRALELAERAIEIGHEDPQVLAITGLVVLHVAKDSRRALAMLSRAYAAGPNDATVMSLNAFANVMTGDIDFGQQCYLRAIEVAPGALDNYELLTGVGVAHMLKGEFEAAIDWSLKALAANPEWIGAMWTLGTSYGLLDRMDEARNIVATILKKAPLMRLADIERIGQRFGPRFQLSIDGLRKAGLPE